jgi:hypothetical protein
MYSQKQLTTGFQAAPMHIYIGLLLTGTLPMRRNGGACQRSFWLRVLEVHRGGTRRVSRAPCGVVRDGGQIHDRLHARHYGLVTV